MRNHVQGIGLVLILAAAIWGTARLAAPALGDAFGDDGAVSAESYEDVIDLSSDADSGALTEEEIYGVQYLLTLEGYDTRGIDGVIGASTRAAIDQAKVDYGLGAAAADRALLDYFLERRDAADGPATDTATTTDTDTTTDTTTDGASDAGADLG